MEIYYGREELMDLHILFIALAFLGLSLVESAPSCLDLPDGSEIIQCSVVYRHGDRTPISEYPKSKYRDPSLWPKRWGHLTLEGMKQHLRFGRWLMREYGPYGKKLLLPYYNASEYKVYSTDVDRTIMSGLANSAGIYEPISGQEIDENIRWQPIPIRAVPADENDKIFAQFCPYVDEAFLKLRDHRYEELMENNYDLFDYAEKHSGYGMIKDPKRMFWLYDTLFCENSTFREIPVWAESIFPNPLQSYYMEFLHHYGYTEKLRRLTGGPILKTIIETMINKTKGTDTIKLYSYSAHDTNVFSILKALALPPQEPPSYTAAIIFELYRSPENVCFIRLMYRPGPDMDPVPLIVPGCGGGQTCRLNVFIEVIAHVLPNDLKAECQAATPEFAHLSQNREEFMNKHTEPFVR